jgi:repressor LexA
MSTITPKQQKVLDVLRRYIARHKQGPTIRELQEELQQSGLKLSSSRSVTQYLDQLGSNGFIRRTGQDRGITIVERAAADNLVRIPILGTANAGQPVAFAETDYQGYLPVSKKLIKNTGQSLFAVKIFGTSMNLEKVEGGNLENGDYAIVDSSKKSKQNSKPFLFTIEGCATIKSFRQTGDEITLLPNSSEEHEPIYLHKDDNVDILGQVVRVFKRKK